MTLISVTARRRRSHVRIDLKRIVIAALVAVAALSLAWAAIQALGPDGSRDNQWSGAHVLAMGLDPSRVFAACLANACTPDPFILSQYPNYPISTLALMAPYGALPWPVAKIVWLGVNLLSIAVLLGSARKIWAPRLGPITLTLAFLTFLIATPLRNQIENGQLGLFALAMFALAYRCARHDQRTLGGLFLALAWTKFTLTLPLSLVFVARRDWKIVIVAVACHALLTIGAAAWTGTDLLDSTFGFLAVAKSAVNTQYGYLDVFGIASRIDAPGIAAAGLAMLLTVAGIRAGLRGGKDEILLMAVMSLLSMAVFYHLSYDAVMFFPPFLYAIQLIRERHGYAFALPVLALVAMAWFGNRLIAGNEYGYWYGSPFQHAFSWLMAATFYGAIAIGLYRLWKTRANAMWRESFLVNPVLRETR